MVQKHIIVVNHEPELLSQLETTLKNSLPLYNINCFPTTLQAVDEICRMDERGDILGLVATDDRNGGALGHELLKTVADTHPASRRIFYYSGQSPNSLHNAILQKAHQFVTHDLSLNDSTLGLYNVIKQQIEAFERQPKVQIELDNILIKLADTRYEVENLFSCRYKNYLGAKHLTLDDFTEEQIAKQQEWDEFDNIPETRYVVAKINGKTIGGARIIDGNLPMETGIIKKTGEKFSLNNHREKGVYTREISRLVVDYEHRTSEATALTGVFRIISNLTCDHDYMFCTAREKQIPLYQAIGFELINDEDSKPIVIKYKLRGDWYPMVASRTKTLEEPEKISGFVPEFYNKSTRVFDRITADEWIDFSKKIQNYANKTGFFEALFVGNGKTDR